jgi:hypothetical protein
MKSRLLIIGIFVIVLAADLANAQNLPVVAQGDFIVGTLNLTAARRCRNSDYITAHWVLQNVTRRESFETPCYNDGHGTVRVQVLCRISSQAFVQAWTTPGRYQVLHCLAGWNRPRTIVKTERWLARQVPHYGYNDMVTARYRLLTEGLGVNHLRLVMELRWEACTPGFGEKYPGLWMRSCRLQSAVQISGRNRMMDTMVIDPIRSDRMEQRRVQVTALA